MAGLGLFFGIVLAVAYRRLRVEEDPRLEVLEGKLPGSNCGACGEPGCQAFARALLAGSRPPSGCTVSSAEAIDGIASFLGVDPGQAEKRVARLHCGGGLGRAYRLAHYQGPRTCRTAHLVAAGGLVCSWGCLGEGDCQRACTFDAIAMDSHLLPVVDLDRCTACGDCVEACPRDLFDLMPVSQKLIVQCRATLAGHQARSLCSAACDACGLCAKDAPEIIRMADNLPVVDPSRNHEATAAATYRCPTGAIRWVEGAQFEVEHA